MIELSSLLWHHARYRPDATAVVCDGHRLSWLEFSQRVGRVGNMLKSVGLGRGDKIATCAANSLELLETYWGVVSIGATLVPLSPLLLAGGLASLLRGSDAHCLVTESSMLPVLREIPNELPPHVLLTDGAADGFGDYRALVAAQPAALVPAEMSGEDLFNIMFTSGTTGQPKGIMHPHLVRAMYCTLMANAFRFTPESRTLHTGSIVFNGAFVTLMPTFYLGATYVLHRQFDPQEAIRTIERERITHVMFVPAQIVALLDSPGFQPQRLASLECSRSASCARTARRRIPGRLARSPAAARSA